MSAQETGGAVQSADYYTTLIIARSGADAVSYEPIRALVDEYGAAIRRAAIEECEAICEKWVQVGLEFAKDDRPGAVNFLLGARDCRDDIRALAASGPPTDHSAAGKNDQ